MKKRHLNPTCGLSAQPTNRRDLVALADVLRRAGIGSLAELIFLTHNFDFPAPARGRLGEGASRWSRFDVDGWIHSDAPVRYRRWRRAA